MWQPFRYYSRQQVPDSANSVAQVFFHRMISDINRGVELKCRVSGLLLDKNTVDEYTGFLSGNPDADLDCCFLGIMHWGHNQQAQSARQAHPLENPEDLLYGPIDLTVSISDRTRELTHEHLWLKPTDCDWHRPLMATVRELAHKSWRKRSGEAEERRRLKKEASLAKAKSNALEKRRRWWAEQMGKGKSKSSKSGKGESKGSDSQSSTHQQYYWYDAPWWTSDWHSWWSSP